MKVELVNDDPKPKCEELCTKYLTKKMNEDICLLRRFEV